MEERKTKKRRVCRLEWMTTKQIAKGKVKVENQ